MIIFRNIKGEIPGNWIEGLHWYVEYHDDSADMAFPLGVAYVSHAAAITCLDYILVADPHRRKDIGSALLDACCKRWPGIHITDAISEAGEGLLASAVHGGEAGQ